MTNLSDLNGATVLEQELNPLAYGPGDYPALDTMLQRIFQPLPVTTINLQELSVNGTLKKDSIDEYLQQKYISSSALKEALKTPLHYYYYFNQTFKPKRTKAFDLGTFAHKAFLEPALFDKCVVEPKCNLTTKDGVMKKIQFYWELLKADSPLPVTIDSNMNDLKSFLSGLAAQEEYEVIEEEHKVIIDVLKRHYTVYGGGIIQRLLHGAEYETSFYGNDAETGLAVKVRPDAFNIEENIGVNAIISMKTTSADNIGKFYYDAAKYKYELSEGMYQQVASEITGRKFNATIMIMLQTVPPYAPAVFWWDADDLQLGKYKYREAMNIVAECDAKGIYPGYDALAEGHNYGIINMKLPSWAEKEVYPTDI